jgi:cyclase
VIPSLLLKGAGLVKTRKFSDPTYVGDPLNAIRIYNEKEVDELVILDIVATERRCEPNYELITDIASECFMPLCVGGGIHRLDQIERIFKSGVEKVAINSYALQNPAFIREAADQFGSQSIVASIDARRGVFGGYRVYGNGGRAASKLEPVAWAKQLEELGAGELMVTSIDRDGTMKGYDLELIQKIAEAVTVPIIACGGAGSVADLGSAIRSGAAAAAAGSLFVFHGKHRAVLINFPPHSEFTSFNGTPVERRAA